MMAAFQLFQDRVHDGIRHLENDRGATTIMIYVHDGIRHLEI